MKKQDKKKEDDFPKDIEARLASAGHVGLEVTPRVLAQLQKIDKAAALMAERRQEAIKMLKNNEVTVMNLERVIGESGDKLTDQTMRNSALLTDYIATYDTRSAEKEAGTRLDRLKQEVERYREEIRMLGERDAQVLADRMEIDELRRRNERLEEDKRDLQKLLREAENGAHKHASVVKMKFKKTGDAS